ncbi:MAG: hypothetical protein R2911_41040 [Caldilineaceae bacterium]
MRAMLQLRADARHANFDVLKINPEHLKMTPDVVRIAQVIARTSAAIALPPIEIQQLDDFYTIFRSRAPQKPLILILDEFDALLPKRSPLNMPVISITRGANR